MCNYDPTWICLISLGVHFPNVAPARPDLTLSFSLAQARLVTERRLWRSSRAFSPAAELPYRMLITAPVSDFN